MFTLLAIEDTTDTFSWANATGRPVGRPQRRWLRRRARHVASGLRIRQSRHAKVGQPAYRFSRSWAPSVPSDRGYQPAGSAAVEGCRAWPSPARYTAVATLIGFPGDEDPFETGPIRGVVHID
jgi:hypothetical protein